MLDERVKVWGQSIRIQQSYEKDRAMCYRCRKAAVMCYCEAIKTFASDPEFVILIHPKETRKAINTGRMAFLTLENAQLIVGNDLSESEPLNKLLNDPSKRCFLLFPGPNAIDIADIPHEADATSDGSGPKSRDVFLILDATWTMAKKMLRLSRNLQALPQVMFTPPHASRFIIREQPGVICFSTIETIHYIIEKRGTHPQGEHHRLLSIFDDMVQKQINYERDSRQALSLSPEL